LVAFGAYKFSKRDAKRIEDHSGVSPEEMTDEELERSMAELGIEKQLRGADDVEEGTAPASAAPESAAPVSAGGDSTIEDLERLAQLRDQGVLSEAEFAAKKQQILGS
jgi:hypothetical protein